MTHFSAFFIIPLGLFDYFISAFYHFIQPFCIDNQAVFYISTWLLVNKPFLPCFYQPFLLPYVICLIFVFFAAFLLKSGGLEQIRHLTLL